MKKVLDGLLPSFIQPQKLTEMDEVILWAEILKTPQLFVAMDYGKLEERVVALKFAKKPDGKAEQQQVEVPAVKTKTKAAPKTAEKQVEDKDVQEVRVKGFEKEVDAYVALESELQPYLAKFQELGELRKGIMEGAKEAGEDNPDAMVVIEGSTKVMVFSDRQKTTEIVNRNGLVGALKAKVGYDALIEMLKFSLGDLKKYLSDTELEPFLSPSRGSRRFLKVDDKQA